MTAEQERLREDIYKLVKIFNSTKNKLVLTCVYYYIILYSLDAKVYVPIDINGNIIQKFSKKMRKNTVTTTLNKINERSIYISIREILESCDAYVNILFENGTVLWINYNTEKIIDKYKDRQTLLACYGDILENLERDKYLMTDKSSQLSLLRSIQLKNIYWKLIGNTVYITLNERNGYVQTYLYNLLTVIGNEYELNVDGEKINREAIENYLNTAFVR